jgi:hypothetical protein
MKSPGTMGPWHPVRVAPWPLSALGPLALWPLVLILLAVSSCRDVDVVTAAYTTMAEAEQAGAVRDGWVPSTLPKSAHDILEAHDLDRNRRWGIFSFQPSDAEPLRSTLQQEELSLTNVECDMPGRVEWWPVLLRGQLDPEQVKTAGLKAYRERQGDLIVAVNWSQGRAYYWTR